MKVILLASFLIEFLLRQAVINSVTGRTKLACILIRNQIHGPSFRRRIKENKPNYGYDPYWPAGEWVFSRHATTARGHTAPCTPMLCQKVYKEFGAVCGRNINDTYRTFSDYCEMQDADCNEEKPMKWMVAYRGKCAGELKTFPTAHAHMATRAEEYIKKFNESLTTKRTLPPITLPTAAGGK